MFVVLFEVSKWVCGLALTTLCLSWKPLQLNFGKPNQNKWPCPNNTEFQRLYTQRCHASGPIDPCLFQHQQLYQAVYSERAPRLCQATTALTVSLCFLQSTSLRTELSLITLLTHVIFFFTTFSTVKIVLKDYENEAVAVVIAFTVFTIQTTLAKLTPLYFFKDT